MRIKKTFGIILLKIGQKSRQTSISKHPGLGINYSNIRLDYFGTKVKSHIIFYRNSNLNEIEIIRILHQKMNLRKRILE